MATNYPAWMSIFGLRMESPIAGRAASRSSSTATPSTRHPTPLDDNDINQSPLHRSFTPSRQEQCVSFTTPETDHDASKQPTPSIGSRRASPKHVKAGEVSAARKGADILVSHIGDGSAVVGTEERSGSLGVLEDMADFLNGRNSDTSGSRKHGPGASAKTCIAPGPNPLVGRVGGSGGGAADGGSSETAAEPARKKARVYIVISDDEDEGMDQSASRISTVKDVTKGQLATPPNPRKGIAPTFKPMGDNTGVAVSTTPPGSPSLPGPAIASVTAPMSHLTTEKDGLIPDDTPPLHSAPDAGVGMLGDEGSEAVKEAQGNPLSMPNEAPLLHATDRSAAAVSSAPIGGSAVVDPPIRSSTAAESERLAKPSSTVRDPPAADSNAAGTIPLAAVRTMESARPSPAVAPAVDDGDKLRASLALRQESTVIPAVSPLSCSAAVSSRTSSTLPAPIPGPADPGQHCAKVPRTANIARVDSSMPVTQPAPSAGWLPEPANIQPAQAGPSSLHPTLRQTDPDPSNQIHMSSSADIEIPVDHALATCLGIPPAYAPTSMNGIPPYSLSKPRALPSHRQPKAYSQHSIPTGAFGPSPYTPYIPYTQHPGAFAQHPFVYSGYHPQTRPGTPSTFYPGPPTPSIPQSGPGLFVPGVPIDVPHPSSRPAGTSTRYLQPGPPLTLLGRPLTPTSLAAHPPPTNVPDVPPPPPPGPPHGTAPAMSQSKKQKKPVHSKAAPRKASKGAPKLAQAGTIKDISTARNTYVSLVHCLCLIQARMASSSSAALNLATFNLMDKADEDMERMSKALRTGDGVGARVAYDGIGDFVRLSAGLLGEEIGAGTDEEGVMLVGRVKHDLVRLGKALYGGERQWPPEVPV